MIDRSFACDLVARFGSPLYAYDLGEVQARTNALFAALPRGAKLFYSFKANPLPAIASAARDAGCRGEISSIGELKAAQAAGFGAEQLLFGGPGKTNADIRAALDAGIAQFSSESWNDLARINSAAKKQNRKVKILLRVNPSKAPQAKLVMTGVESQFGFEEEILLGLKERFKSLSDTVEIIGVHVFFGTQIAPDTIVATTRVAIETAERISRELGFACKVIDAGGGFPWPYASADAGSDLANLKQEFADLLAQNEFARSAELWFESGRYIAASSGTLITTVLDVKESKGGKKYVVLDSGINHLGGMSGLGRIPRPFVSIQQISEDEKLRMSSHESFDVVGPLCSPLDSLARNLKAAQLAVGDVIAIPNVGAYGLTASLIGFLSHPPPKEIAYRGRKIVSTHQMRWGHEKI
jgi:diaminopimelate decarboxylase